jgi:hypothetical protein
VNLAEKKCGEKMSERNCPICGDPVPEAARGRPRRFCSAPCLKLATADIRRINNLIGRLEDRLSHLRTLRELTGWEDCPIKLTTELALQRARLRALLDDLK